ncbi:MAG: hypothetical protein MK101_11655 [Phycisphaerales bacterium]|nr:hypothetical protein [Phycisphaerales bacterium]
MPDQKKQAQTPKTKAQLQQQIDSGNNWFHPKMMLGAAVIACIGGPIFWATEIHRDLGMAGFPWDLIVITVIVWFFLYFGLLAAMRNVAGQRIFAMQSGWKKGGRGDALAAAGIDAPQAKAKSHALSGQHTDYAIVFKQFDDRTVVASSYDLRLGDERVSYSRVMLETGTSAPRILVHNRGIAEHGLLGKIKQQGLAPVSFEVDDFNKHWSVFAEDAKGAFDLFDQSTLDYFCSNPSEHIQLEFCGELMLLWCRGGGMDRKLDLFKQAQAIAVAVPDDLIAPITILEDTPDDAMG